MKRTFYRTVEIMTTVYTEPRFQPIYGLRKPFGNGFAYGVDHKENLIEHGNLDATQWIQAGYCKKYYNEDGSECVYDVVISRS